MKKGFFLLALFATLIVFSFPPPTHASASSCPSLTHTLSLGSTDAGTAGDVSALQRMLATDSTLYPEKFVSGYFDSATEKAVKRFQARYGIVSSGDRYTTGYGKVGDSTAHALLSWCKGVLSVPAPVIVPAPTPKPVVTPPSAPAPLPAGPATPITLCLSISHTLSVGSSGTDVSSLQTFLATDPSLYPEGLVTGYFGPATERATQRLQARNALVSSGTPATTGYGLVGVKTRALLQSECSAPADTAPAPAVVATTTPDTTPTCTLSTSAGSASPGSTVVLTWTTTNADTVSIDNGVGTLTLSGVRSVTPSATVLYTLTADGAGGEATCTAGVTVGIPAPTCSLTVTPTSITAGGSATLSWTTGDATSAQIDNGVGGVSITSASRTVYPSTDTTYTMTVDNVSGEGVCGASVSISSQEIQPLWARLYGLVGPYGIQTADEIGAMANAGFSLMLIGPKESYSQPFRDAIVSNHVSYIDDYPEWELYSACHFQQNAGVCAPADLATALAKIKSHLATVADDQNLIAFWILDDYPGADIRPLLEQVHALIDDANKTAVFPRPAICGFGSSLDYKNAPTDAAFTPRQQAVFDTKTVTNFDPAACDAIAFYDYGVNKTSLANDTTLLDWSMSALLPHKMQVLTEHGWDQAKVPLIGMPGTFGGVSGDSAYSYVLPTAANIATQSLAYCKAGAIALLPFTWHSGSSSGGPWLEPYNTPSLIQGLQQGMVACKQYWTASFATAPRSNTNLANVFSAVGSFLGSLLQTMLHFFGLGR